MKLTYTTISLVLVSAAYAQDQLPTCATTCVTNALNGDGCTLTDFACHCGHYAQLQASVTPCINAACSSAADRAAVVQYVQDTCAAAGVPIVVSTSSAGATTATSASSSSTATSTSASSSVTASTSTGTSSSASSSLASGSSASSSSTSNSSSVTSTTATSTSTSTPTSSASVATATGNAAAFNSASSVGGILAVVMAALFAL